MARKRRNNLIGGLGSWLISHPWLKLIALILAIMVWFYIRGEIARFNY